MAQLHYLGNQTAAFNPLIFEPLKNTRKLQYIGTYVKKSAIPSYLHNE